VFPLLDATIRSVTLFIQPAWGAEIGGCIPTLSAAVATPGMEGRAINRV